MAFIEKLIRSVGVNLLTKIPVVGGILSQFAGWGDTATQDQIADIVCVQNLLKIKLQTQQKTADALLAILSGPDAVTGPLREPIEELAAALADPKALAPHTAEKLDAIEARFDGDFDAFEKDCIRIFAPQNAENIAAGAVVVQIQGDGNSITINDEPFVAIDTLDVRIRRITQSTPGNDLLLLRPDSRTTELIGRDRDIEDFMAWLNSDAPISVRVVVGGAGAGKTRLAIELMLKLAENDAPEPWCTGFVNFQHLRTFDLKPSLTQADWPQPTLLVVDYAAIETSLLKPWITYLAQLVSEDSHVRILLIERNADAQRGWLNELLAWGGDTSPGLSGVFDPPVPIALTPLTLDDDCADRRQILQTMLTRIGDDTGKPLPDLPAPGEDKRFDIAIQATQWADPLYLMMAALVASESKVVTALSMSRTDLGQALAQREIKRITSGVADDAKCLRIYLAACATLARGLDSNNARAVAAILGEQTQREYPGGLGALVDDLAELLPGAPTTLDPIQPDIIAEAFVYLGISAGRRPLDDAQRDAIILKLIELTNEGPLKTLMLLIQDYAKTWPDTLDWLEYLAQHAHAENFNLFVRIANKLPTYTLALREKAVDIQTVVTRRLKAMPIPEDIDASIRQRNRIAQSLNNLAIRLSDAGKRDEALKAAREATDIRRKLATERPAAFESDLANSMNNLANRLSDAGLRNEALETARKSIDITRKLAAERPGAFELDLAHAINNLATILRDVGLHDEALKAAIEAVDIFRKLAATRPDAFEPDLAMSLTNLATMLRDVSLHNEALETAREAVDICRKLANEHPDAFEPDLAMALSNLANSLSDVGLRDEGLEMTKEATDIYRKLATANPDVFEPYLAISLSNLATRFRHFKLHDEALDIAGEAIDIRRKLAAVDPDAFEPDLANSLTILHLCHKIKGQLGEALEAITEALCILKPFFLKLPQAFADLMDLIVREYQDCIEKLEKEPDMELLGPMVAVLQQLNQSDCETDEQGDG